MNYGALEAGGTKMVCAVYNHNNGIVDKISIPTLKPEQTMPKMIEFFKNYNIVSLGIGCFGPINLNKNSNSYGCITSTPKLAWRNYPILEQFKDILKVNIGFDTDVNAAALAEAKLGIAKGLSSCVYITVGTGVGGGCYIENNLVHGLVHPEIGHILLAPCKNDPLPDGICPYHKGCLEGHASGPAIQAKWGKSAKDLFPEDLAWDIESYYLAQMCMNLILTISPEKIILGGGVMQQKHLFPKIRKKTTELLNGYIQHDMITQNTTEYIVEPGLGTLSGITGALLLAKKAYANNLQK